MLIVLGRHRSSLSLIAAAASWGVATVISKRAVAEIRPLILLPMQLAVSVGTLTLLGRAQKPRRSWSPEIRRLGTLGILNPGISYALSLFGLSYITASLSVLLWAIEPLMILGLAWWLLGDQITRPLAVSSVVALAGVVLVVFQAGSRGALIGIALTMAGVGACAVYAVVSRQLMIEESTLAMVTVQQWFALAFSIALLGVSTVVGQSTQIADVSLGAWISAGVSGVLYYAIGFWFYLSGLRRLSASVAGAFINLVPVFGIAASHVLLGERLSGRQWFGAVLIVAAVGIVARQPLGSQRHPPTPTMQ